jgi:hypothetical protein
MNKATLSVRLILSFCLVGFSFSAFAQKFPATWFEVGISKEIAKNLKLEFNPELRFLDSLKMDSYILEGGLSYKVHKYFSLAGFYRFDQVYKYKKKNGEYKGQESLNMLAFDAKSGIDVSRFGISARLRYTHGIFDFNNASEIRFRTKLDYNIRNCKFSPYASVEFFHDYLILDVEREVISGYFNGVDKIRYVVGTSYAFNKNHELSVYYRIQDNRIKNETNNVIGIGYNFDF